MYVSPTDLGYDAVIEGWIKNRAKTRDAEAKILETILRKYLITMRFIEL